MSWKPIDFQGIISLDSPIIDLLNQFLDEKEEELALGILHALPDGSSEEIPVRLSPPEPPLTIDSALELFEKRNYQQFHRHHDTTSQALFDKALFKKSIEQLNQVLWDYVEVLEGCTTELFIQLEQISLEQWHERLAHVVGSIKEMFAHRMEDLIWAIKRLEKQLQKYKQMFLEKNSFESLWQRISSLWSSLLDRNLISNLLKSQDFLREQYQRFMKRYRGYLKLEAQLEPFLEKLKDYRALNNMERESEKMILKIYLILKLWELNRSEKALPSQEFIVAVHNMVSVDRGTTLLKEYYQALYFNLFDISLHIKMHNEELSDVLQKSLLLEEISGYQQELHTLGVMVTHYREFLIKTNPDPYVRTRLGYSEETVGAEPAYTKPLLTLGYDIEGLEELYKQFSQSLKNDEEWLQKREKAIEIDKDLRHILHEMGHPLASYRFLRSKGETFLAQLLELDELGSRDNDIIDYFSVIFARLLRIDWKYSALAGIPLFHKLYAIHQGLLKPVEDRSHLNRLAKFNFLLQRIAERVKTQKVQSHAHDIELDMNDIKGYLQDFLGSIQRVTGESNITPEQADKLYVEISQQLLEYRYLFNNFFYQLRQNESEGYYIRRQLLFVDQYFETVEAKLFELQPKAAEEETA